MDRFGDDKDIIGANPTWREDDLPVVFAARTPDGRQLCDLERQQAIIALSTAPAFLLVSLEADRSDPSGLGLVYHAANATPDPSNAYALAAFAHKTGLSQLQALKPILDSLGWSAGDS